MERAKRINSLKDYFKNHPDIVFAFLFGSVKDRAFHSGSDWDIGVYFQPAKGEGEEGKFCMQEAEIFSHLVNILGTDNIDLIVLNRAPSELADTVIRCGQALIIKNKEIFWEFFLNVTREAEDYRDFVEEYYRIYERSLSLSKEDRTSLEKRIVFLENELKDFSYYKEYTFALYQRDVHKRRELERWVENIINVIIDISKIVVASYRMNVPATYREAVEKMVCIGIEEDIVSSLGGWVYLRNILAHQYLDLRWEKIKDFLSRGEGICNKFLKGVKNLLDK